MCLVGTGLTEVFLIDRLDLRIVVRLSVGQIEVILIQCLCSERFEVGEVSHMTGLDRLTAAVYAAAGAAHDLNKLIVTFMPATS